MDERFILNTEGFFVYGSFNAIFVSGKLLQNLCAGTFVIAKAFVGKNVQCDGTAE